MGASIEDPMNRAFEAIARREAHELQLQTKEQEQKQISGEENCFRFFQFEALKSEVAPSTSTPSKKGQTATRDAEADHPIYLLLSHPIHEKLAMQNHEQVNVIDKILHELLMSGDSAQNYMLGSRRMTIDNRVHLDNKVQEPNMSSGMALTKALQGHSKRSKKHMSMKQHKKHGSLDLPKELQKNIRAVCQFITSQNGLGISGKSQMAQCLLSVDLHSAHILVAECKMAAFTGVSGIMVRATAETFGIITKYNKFKLIAGRLHCMEISSLPGKSVNDSTSYDIHKSQQTVKAKVLNCKMWTKRFKYKLAIQKVQLQTYNG